MMLHKKEAMPNFFVKTDGAGGGESSVSVFRRIDRRDLVIKRSLDGICICVHKHNFYMIFAWLAHLVPILYGIVFIWAYKENSSLYAAMRGWTDPWWDDFVLMHIPVMREVVAETKGYHYGELSFAVRHLYGISLMMVPVYVTLYYVILYAFWKIRIGQKRLVRMRILRVLEKFKKWGISQGVGGQCAYSVAITLNILFLFITLMLIYHGSFISRHDIRIGASYVEIESNIWLMTKILLLNTAIVWCGIIFLNMFLMYIKIIYQNYRTGIRMKKFKGS